MKESKKKSAILPKVIKEIRLFYIYAIFLFLLFSTFNIYQRLLLKEYGYPYLHYGYSIVEAFILSKVILIGEGLKLGESYENKPLIIPVIYKTILFSLLLILFSILEHIVITVYKGTSFTNFYKEFSTINPDLILAKTLVMVFIFFFFFSFLELDRILGRGQIIKLFFMRRDKNIY